MKTRNRHTLDVAAMFTVDLLVSVVIPTALYVVKMRPTRFRKWVLRLYADKLQPSEVRLQPKLIMESPEMAAAFERKLLELERQNFNYAKALGKKNRPKPHQ